MKTEYNARNFMRLIPSDLLSLYFASHNVLQDFDWSVVESDVEPLYEVWIKLPAELRQKMSVDFQRVWGLASRQGIQTILAAAESSDLEISSIVKKGRSSIEKVFNVLLEKPEVFRIASRFAWADNLRRYWFRRSDLPAVDADLSDKARAEFKAAISAYYLKNQCRGSTAGSNTRSAPTCITGWCTWQTTHLRKAVSRGPIS